MNILVTKITTKINCAILSGTGITDFEGAYMHAVYKERQVVCQICEQMHFCAQKYSFTIFSSTGENCDQKLLIVL